MYWQMVRTKGKWPGVRGSTTIVPGAYLLIGVEHLLLENKASGTWCGLIDTQLAYPACSLVQPKFANVTTKMMGLFWGAPDGGISGIIYSVIPVVVPTYF